MEYEEIETNETSGFSCSRKVAEKIAEGELTLRTVIGKSKVWSLYAKIIDQDGTEVSGFVCCRKCKGVFSYTKSKSSTNLTKHKCYIIMFILEQKPQSSTSIIDTEIDKLETSNSYIEYNAGEKLENNLTKLITRCVINNCTSYEFIQSNECKEIFEEFIAFGAKFGTLTDVQKLLPSSAAITETINEIYGNCFAKVKAEIASIQDNGYALAIHIWENNFIKKKYLALTIHFLKNGSLTWRLLGLRPMDGEKYESLNISGEIDDILENYNCKLSSALSAVVTSAYGATMKSQTIPCITNLLNNALQKSVGDIPEVAKLINACTRLGNFLETKNYNNLPNLMQSFCPSRWITINRVLSSIEVHWVQINDTLKSTGEEAKTEAVNLSHLRSVVEVLGKFEEALYELEKDSDATLHLVMVYLHELKKFCDRHDSENEAVSFIATLKKNMRLHLEKIVSEDITITHKLALFLYPPTKKLPLFSNKEKECIEQECIRLMKYFKSDLKPHIKQEPGCTAACEPKRRKILSDFLESETNTDPDELIIEELQIYKITRVVMNSEEFDVFGWWEHQRDNFPLLYKLSRSVLATPASSIVAQRIFISVGSLLCDKIAGLGSDETNVEHLAFIKCNAEQDDLDIFFNTIISDDQTQ